MLKNILCVSFLLESLISNLKFFSTSFFKSPRIRQNDCIVICMNTYIQVVNTFYVIRVGFAVVGILGAGGSLLLPFINVLYIRKIKKKNPVQIFFAFIYKEPYLFHTCDIVVIKEGYVPCVLSMYQGCLNLFRNIMLFL